MSLQVLKIPQSIVLYSRPLCGWCLEAKAWLDTLGWKYEIHDTGADPAARERAVRVSGTTYGPVIEVDDLVLGDFDTGQLQEVRRKTGYLR